jgi:filamentous hemagglutinin family protein
MRKQVSVNSQANIARSGSLNLTYCFSRHTLNKVNFLFINILLWGMLASSGHPTVAQIVPDATLGIESSVVTPLDDVGLPIDLIEGGATRSGNLFHSFLEFNIDAERGAYFYSPADIQNILARVTGANPSRILGLLGTIGDSAPNLFLINPNGIIFGQNAQLNVEGSFVATTANSLMFENGFAFSATTPQSPPLLTISVPVGLQYGGNAASIETQGSRLQVPDGKTLALVGGNLQLNSTLLEAPEGRVELAGVSGSGAIGLEVNNSNLRLSVPQGIARTDVSVNGSVIRSLGDGGSITIYARNLTIDRSSVRAGFDSDFGFNGTQAGDITLDATGEVKLGQGSRVANDVFPDSTGNGGNIYIRASSVSLKDDAQISDITYGRGNAGKIVIQAINSVSLAGKLTGILSNVGSEAVGQGGDINIQTGSLSIKDGAALTASTFGQGDAGNITVQADQSILLVNGQIQSTVQEGARGRGGAINIQAGSLSLDDGAFVDSSVLGQGRGGNIKIQVGSLSLTGDAALSAATFGQGNAGDIFVVVNDSFALTNSNIFTVVGFGGVGQGGNINIQANSLSLMDESLIANNTFGQGNSGRIQVQTNNSISLTGHSGIASGVYERAVGDGGDILIGTRLLSLTEGSQLFAGTFGKGNSGNIQVEAANSINLAGVAPDGFSGGLFTSTETGATGRGGDIRVSTGTLRVSDGAVLSAITGTPFKGGSIDVHANILEVTNGGQLLTTAFNSGDAGNITVNATDHVSLAGSDSTFATRLTLFGSDVVDNDGPASGLFARTEGAGAAGNVIINTPLLTVRDRSQVSASTSGGAGGSISVRANRFEAIAGGQLRTTTAGSNNAGSINLNVAHSVTLAGSNSGLFANTERGSLGNGGSISITNPRTVVMRDGASVAVDSQGIGEGGNIQVQAGAVTLNNQASISAETASNTGGNITLQVQDLLLMRQGSRISTSAGTAQAGGDGGNISIDAQFVVAVPKENSDITANAFTGRGGNINITTQGIYGLEFRPRLTSLSDITASSEFGVNGTVQIDTPGVDPSRGLANLPVEPVNVEVAQGCQATGKQGAIEFFNTGRGGLASNPYEPLSSSEIWEDVPLSAQEAGNSASASVSPAVPPNKLVEAQGWLVNDKGEVTLVAEMPLPLSRSRCRLR